MRSLLRSRQYTRHTIRALTTIAASIRTADGPDAMDRLGRDREPPQVPAMLCPLSSGTCLLRRTSSSAVVLFVGVHLNLLARLDVRLTAIDRAQWHIRT